MFRSPPASVPPDWRGIFLSTSTVSPVTGRSVPRIIFLLFGFRSQAAIFSREIGHTAKCPLEKWVGWEATRRLQMLTANGFRTQPTGRKGRYGRALATIILPDGREAGAVLVHEGLATVYGAPGYKEWCG